MPIFSRPFMRTSGTLAAFLLLVLTAGPAFRCASTGQKDARPGDARTEEGWRPLFDGKTLAGWRNPYDWGEAWVEKGEIRLRADKKFFLVTEQTYRDFVFEAEIRMPEGTSNSGVMFRSHVEPNRVYGYQAEVDPSERQWSGGLYDEGRREWLNPIRGDSVSIAAFRARAGDAFQAQGWNRYRIRSVGDTLQIYVNDVLTTDYLDAMDREGYIGLQHHGEQGQVYRFRNLRIKELDIPAAGVH